MKTLLITGGTDGMGKALAEFHLRRGDRVAVIGRSAAKGEDFRAFAASVDASDRAFFFLADLGLVEENRRVAAEVMERFPVVDALVLGARFFRSQRFVTSEGFEETFALYYLSRFLLSHGLLPSLERANRPVIVNVAGPGEQIGEIFWDDLQLERSYHGLVALGWGGRLSDLLGLGFRLEHGERRTRYVLFHPGVVQTGFAGDYEESMLPAMASLRETAKPVEESIVPIAALIDTPPEEALTAFAQTYDVFSPQSFRRVSMAHSSWSDAAGKRLYDITCDLLAGHDQRRSGAISSPAN